jgi:hypothetical protein
MLIGFTTFSAYPAGMFSSKYGDALQGRIFNARVACGGSSLRTRTIPTSKQFIRIITRRFALFAITHT